jgi:hypothetical protein
MAPATYRYELRRGEAVTATGHITLDAPFEVGDEIAIGTTCGTVKELGPRLSDGERRLVVQLPDVQSEHSDA